MTFEEFADAQQGSLLRVAFVLTADRYLAEDLVQTALTIPYLDDLGQNITPAPVPWSTTGNVARPTGGPGNASQSSPPRAPGPASSSQYAPVPPSGTSTAEAGTAQVPASRPDQADASSTALRAK